MEGLPEGFVVDEPRAADDLPEGFAVDAPVDPLPPAAPKSGGGVIKTVLDPIIGTGKEAWRTTKEQAQSAWGNLKHGLAPREAPPGEGFAEGYLRDVASTPQRFIDTSKGLLEAAGLPLAPATGAGKYAIGKPMAHLLSIPNKITGKGPDAESIYEDIRDDIGTALGAVGNPLRRNPRTGVVEAIRPLAPRQPPRQMGVQLSEGQRSQDLPLIQREQAARRNQLGEQAQRETQDWFDNQAREVAAALENTMIDMDPVMSRARAGQRHLVAETPLEAGQIVSNGMLQTRNMRRETVSNFYETARQQSGVIQADFFDNVGHRIKQDLSGGTEPVVINERLTPFADMAMQDIDQNVSNLIMQNRGSPHPQPPRSQIYGIDLAGVDFMRRRLVSRRRDAYNSGNESDGRAMSALVDAFDSQINQAMNGGRFTGSPRAIGYWNDARAAHAQYSRDFTAGRNDPAGKAIERIVGRNNNTPLIANDVVDEIFGSTGTNPSHKNVEVARRIQRILGSDSPEWIAVRQGLFSRLVEPAPGVSEYSPRRVRDRINNFLQNGRELADEVFTADQQARLREFADLNDRLIVPQEGANWSNNRFNSLVNRGIQGGAAAAGGLAGHGLLPVPGVGEVLGITGGNYVGKRLVDAKNAREVRQQFPGADARSRPRYTAQTPIAAAASRARGPVPPGRKKGPLLMAPIPGRHESMGRRAAGYSTLTDQEDDPEHKRHSIESMVPGSIESMLSLPRYEEGGSAPAGQPIVVGEAGPEVIVPQEDVEVMPHWLETGMVPTPPESEPMTRALPGYEQRDPAELAAMRHQQMARPDAGRADFTPEHIANMATTAAAFTPAGVALAPEMLAGRAVAAGAQHAPKITSAVLAAVAAMMPSAVGGAEDTQSIKDLQTKLRDGGYYRGDIDGKMGPDTRQAMKDLTAAEKTRMDQENTAKQLETQQGSNTAAIETARAQKAVADAKIESEKLQAEREEKLLERKKSADDRIREIDKDLSVLSRVIRDYSGPAGLALGTMLGAGGRALTSGTSNKFTREAAKAGDEIMKADVTAAKKGSEAALARATRANEFWRKGGAKEVPFRLEPGKAPGFAANPKASPLGKTYDPQIHPAVEAAAIAPAAIEEEISRHYKSEWEDKLAEAEKAFSEDPSEINIQRINKAKDNVALFTGLQRLGMSSATVQGVGAVGSRFMKKPPNMRPNMQPAENEQASLQQMIRKASEASEKRSMKNVKAIKPAGPGGGVPPAQFSKSAAKARQKTAEESLQGIERKLGSGATAAGGVSIGSMIDRDEDPKKMSMLETSQGAYAPEEQDAMEDEYHFGRLPSSKVIDDLDKRSGTFEPYRELLNDNPEINSQAKENTKIIARAYEEGNPKVRAEVDRFIKSTHSEIRGIKPNRIPSGALWEIYGSSVSRHLRELAYNSDISDEGKQLAKEWAGFDAKGRPRFPVQEILSIIEKGREEPNPVRPR